MGGRRQAYCLHTGELRTQFKIAERAPTRKDGNVAMSPKEKFQIELLKLIISFHNSGLLDSNEMVDVLKEMVTDAEEAMKEAPPKIADWFDEWMERQAS